MAAQNAIRAGRAFVELFADNTKLIKGLRAAKKSLRSFGNDVTALGKQFAKATAVFATPFILGAKVFAEFQEQGAFVSTMLSNATKHMGGFNRALRDMSVQFGESTSTLSLGLYDILSASIPAEKALSTLDASVRAARAGMIDTRTAADALTTMLNSYSLSADRAADMSDLLFMIVKRGKTTLAELAPVIGQVASIAASANVSLEEFGAALATMTRAGVRTENAVTSLRAIISSFLKPTDTSARAAERLGFAMSSTTLATEGLLGVFKRIQHLSPEQISELFPNIRALKGVIPALKQMTGFTKDIGLMGNRAGATDVAFGKMTNTLKFEFNKALQSGILVLSQMGESLAKPIEKILKAITTVGRITATWVKNNRDIIRSLARSVVIFGAASAAVISFGAILIGSSAIIGAVVASLTAIAGAAGIAMASIGLFASTIGTTIAQVAIAAAAMYGFRGSIKTLSDSAKRAAESFAKSFGSLKAFVQDAMKNVSDAIAANDIELATAIVVDSIKILWQKAINFIQAKWDTFRDSFERISYSLSKLFTTSMNVVKKVIDSVRDTTKKWVDEALKFAEKITPSINTVISAIEWLNKAIEKSSGLFSDFIRLVVQVGLKPFGAIVTDGDLQILGVGGDPSPKQGDMTPLPPDPAELAGPPAPDRDKERRERSAELRELRKDKSRLMAVAQLAWSEQRIRQGLDDDSRKRREENARKVADLEIALAQKISEAKIRHAAVAAKKAKDAARTARDKVREGLAEELRQIAKKHGTESARLAANRQLRRGGFATIPDPKKDLAAASTRAFESSGTFSAQAIAGLTSGEATSERIAKATELTAALIKKLKKKTFAP